MTRLPWSSQCVKYLLFIFNLLFVITGIILISVGATVHGIYGNYSKFLSSGGYLSTSSFMIAIGVIIFIISFFGCCGAIKESSCMIITFSALMIIIFIFELAVGISGYVLKDNTEAFLTNSLNNTMKEYNSSKEMQGTVDFIQKAFNCCGVETFEDWHTYHFIPNENAFPLSCCDTTGQTIFTCMANSTELHKTGCVQGFGNFVKSHAFTLGGVALAISFVQLIGIIFSCYLAKQIKYYYFSA